MGGSTIAKNGSFDISGCIDSVNFNKKGYKSHYEAIICKSTTIKLEKLSNNDNSNNNNGNTENINKWLIVILIIIAIIIIVGLLWK